MDTIGDQGPIYGGETPNLVPTVRIPGASPYPAGFQTGNHAFDEVYHLDGPTRLLACGLARRISALMPRFAADVGREFPWRFTAETLLIWDYTALGQELAASASATTSSGRTGTRS